LVPALLVVGLLVVLSYTDVGSLGGDLCAVGDGFPVAAVVEDAAGLVGGVVGQGLGDGLGDGGGDGQVRALGLEAVGARGVGDGVAESVGGGERVRAAGSLAPFCTVGLQLTTGFRGLTVFGFVARQR